MPAFRNALPMLAFVGAALSGAAVHCAPATEIYLVVTARESACIAGFVATVRTGVDLTTANRIDTPVASTVRGCDASKPNIGTLVLSPSGHGGRVAIVVRGNPTDKPEDEIVARRDVTYASGSRITLRVDLRAPCANAPCSSPNERASPAAQTPCARMRASIQTRAPPTIATTRSSLRRPSGEREFPPLVGPRTVVRWRRSKAVHLGRWKVVVRHDDDGVRSSLTHCPVAERG